MKAKTVIRSLVLGALFLMVPAHADFHFMKIVEVFGGTAAAPNAQYVVLQMYASGQHFVSGHDVSFFDETGLQVAAATFPDDVDNGASQARILVATQAAQAFFGIQGDLTMPEALASGGGKICFATSIDCFVWGGWGGSRFGVGTPFNEGDAFPAGRAAIRRLDIAGSASLLEAADDTDDCAFDFLGGTPAPRNNAGAVGSAPSSTCGNDVVEGLEQCDDGNLSGGDGCSSTCAIDEVIQQATRNDFDGDGEADLFWRHHGDGRNIVWRSGRATTLQAATRVSSLDWEVVGIGDFDGDARADAFWRNRVSGRNVIWLAGHSGTLQAAPRVSNVDWQVVGVGDFDGDGRDDAFWRNRSNGRNVIWLSGNASTSQAVRGVTNLDWEVVGVGDFDGDGRDDAFWRNRSSGSNVIWRSGNASTPQATTRVTNVDWEVVGVGDFDGDGHDDAFWRNRATGRNVIWLSGNAATSQSTTGVTDVDWQVSSVGDFNGDGRADAFWRHRSHGRNAIWLSGNAATQQATPRVSDPAWRVVPSRVPEQQSPPAESGPVLTISNASVNEGDGGTTDIIFTIRLSYAPSSPVAYQVATSDETASAPSDYGASSLANESFASGETTRTFTVMVFGDIEEEGDETFHALVSGVSGAGAVLGDGAAVGTIRDDDYGY